MSIFTLFFLATFVEIQKLERTVKKRSGARLQKESETGERRFSVRALLASEAHVAPRLFEP